MCDLPEEATVLKARVTHTRVESALLAKFHSVVFTPTRGYLRDKGPVHFLH